MFRTCMRSAASSEFVLASAAPISRWLSATIAALALLVGLGTPDSAQAQGQTAVTITPSSRVVVGQTTLEVTVLWCGYPPTVWDMDSRSIKVNGVDVTANFDLQPDPIACGFYGNISDEILYKSTGTITIPSPQAYVTAEVWDWSHTYLTSAMPQTYKLPDPRRRIVVVADAQFQEVRPSTAQSQRFTLYNSGAVRDTFGVSRTCTGTTSGCSLSASSVALDAGQSTAVTVGFTSGAVGATGSITVRAWRNADAGFADSSWTDVSVTAGPPTGVAIVGNAPGVGDVVRRGLCVAVAAGSGAAAECGDLRLVHALPGVRALGSLRTPTLLYNSQHARPKPLVVANITLPTTGPSGSQVPTTVEGRIYIGGVQRGFGSWNGSHWGSLGSTRRVVVPGDDQTWTQGRSDITVEMKYVWPNASVTYASQAGALVVVNRAGSPFGAGWWLAGLEQLHWLGTQRMVVGGDGSVRVYNPVGSNRYVSADPEHPDTLDGSGADYVRKAPNGLRILFSAATGRHVATINRLGYRTDYTYDGNGRLASIQVPTLGSPLTYTFSYSGSFLSAVTAPGGRQVTVFSSSARVDSIQDPDSSRVRFTYGSGVNQYRVATRTDRRGKVTTFGWNDAAQRLTQVQRPLGITTTLAFAETKGLASAVPVDSAYTAIDGPRSDVADVTTIWVNGHGAPTRIRNAVGRETLIGYAAAWPGLAAATKGPSGLLTGAWYNGRGLPDSTIAYNPLGNGQNALTRYQWHATWDAVTQVTSPTGLVTTFGYNATNGNREWEQVGPDQGRRVNYGYNANGLLSSVTTPAGTQYLYYDNTLGNLQRNRSPRGFDTYSYGDALGRDTLVVSPFDSVPPGGSLLTRTRTFFSVADRVDSVRTWGPAVGTPYRTHHADSVTVLNVYDAEGSQLTATRLFRLNGAMRSLSSSWTYDDLGRVTGQSDPGAGSRTFILDPAGNVTTTYTPRGHTIAVTYDALNRPSRKVLSQVDYANIACPAFPGACQLFSFPTREGPTVCLANDTAYFDYDAAGNLRRADNGWAWVRRGYTPSGLVSHDTLVVRTYETSAPNPCGPGDRHSGGIASGYPDFSSHVYALRYSYDLEGRRTDLYHPDGVDFCPSGQCRTQYGYESATGLLSQVTDPLNNVTSFAYDAAGRDTATTYPGTYLHPVVMRRGYDADGNVATRSGPFTSGDALTRDASGRLVAGAIGDIAGNGPANIRLFYGALGAVVYAENLTKGATFEEDSVDALGNRLWQREYGVRPDYMDRQRRLFLDSYTGRLDSIRLVAPLPGGVPELYTRHHVALYDGAGNSHQSYGWPNPNLTQGYWNADLDEAVSYFDAADRLRIFNRHVNYGGVSSPGGLYEEYRYDALGRRVLVRSRCTASQESDGNCRGYVERTVWDGDQVLYEIRAPGQDGAPSDVMEQDTYVPSYPYTSYHALLGRVGYVHAGGLDAPLAVYRLNFPGHPSVIGVAPHANYQGDFEIGSMIGGSYQGWSSRACEGYAGCPVINWPGGNTTIDGELPNPGVPTWFGNLLSQKSDGSGLQYLRNRYYDPRTGRFTQQDPIGLAGGLNLYGFASGDPVNFSDPLGLWIQPLGRAANSAVRRLLAGSGTFRTLYGALQRAPQSRVSVIIRAGATRDELRYIAETGEGRAYAHRDPHGSPDGRILFNPQLAEGSLEDALAHEIVHTAGQYADAVNGETGVSGGCGQPHQFQQRVMPVSVASQCRSIEDRIRSEMEAARARDQNKK